MDEKLKSISDTIEKISELRNELPRITRDEYKCDHYDTYKEEYYKLSHEIRDYEWLLERECNEYVDYPKKQFLFFDWTKKMVVEYNGIFGIELHIPKIEKQEYYCLIKLFNNHKCLFKLHSGNYIFRG